MDFTTIFLLAILLIPISIFLFLNYCELKKSNIFETKKYEFSDAQKISAWIEGICLKESIESVSEDKTANIAKFWGILISNKSNSTIYDIKVTVEETQSGKTIQIHRNINILPPGNYYCRRLYNSSKFPFDIPKIKDNYFEFDKHKDELYDKVLRPLVMGKKKVIKIEFTDNKNINWERNEQGLVKK